MATDPSSDGRRMRAERSRERILDALADALRDPDINITTAEVAARAGVGVSTIFRLFKDADGVTEALTERMAQRVAEHLAMGPIAGRKVEDRVSELVRRRMTLLEAIGPLLRAGSNAPGNRAHQRSQRALLERALAGESRQALQPALDPLARAESKAVLESVGTLLSVDGWAHLRIVRGHGIQATESILTRGVLALVDAR